MTVLRGATSQWNRSGAGRRGATVIARFAFNELVSFVAGWAICLEYLILIAICAFGTTDYAAVFCPEPRR